MLNPVPSLSLRRRYYLCGFLIAFLLFSQVILSLSDAQNTIHHSDDEDLAFLEEENEAKQHGATATGSHVMDADAEEEEDDDDDVGSYSDVDGSESDKDSLPKIDEKDIVVLKERNFSDVIEDNRFVMVEFYAPWCGHCRNLAPEYAAAGTALKEEEVVLAKVDATEEPELTREYGVEGFPTVLFFVDGIHMPYRGKRTTEAIVAWIKKKIGPGVNNITTVDDAQRVLASESKVVLGYLNSLMGSETSELAAASILEDETNFYQTTNPDVAKLFHLDANARRPALVMLKSDAEKTNYFDANFSRSEIVAFVLANKLPLVVNFTQENVHSIFESPIKNQMLLFAISNDSNKVLPEFQEAAKIFKGKLVFVFVDLDNKEVGKPVSNYFGIAGNAPKVIVYTGSDDGRKFLLDGHVSLETIKKFGEDFLEDKLKPFFKSDPIPETNNGDVKIVVGNNFDEIILDEAKDVLLEIYAPWCGHCQALEPTYDKLAKHLRGIDSIVIAKMDGTTNEHPRAKSDGYPTLLFFPAGNKSFDPIAVDADRTVVALYKFIKTHASIPFRLEKLASTSKLDSSDATSANQSGAQDIKDEL